MILCKKLAILFVLLLLLFFLFALSEETPRTGTIYDQGNKATAREMLDRKLGEREAVIWYLGHSGWAVKTKNNFLIFDYAPMGQKNAESSLSNGFINPSEIKDQDVFVFVSHSHGDHYDSTIYDWEKSVEYVTYIFGWKAKEDPKYIYLVEPRAKKRINDIEILTINHSFDEIPEVAFLVKIDGLVIFHSGDHGSTGEVLNPTFKNNIDYLESNASGIDIAFISQFGYRGGGEVNKGDLYTIEKLRPKVTFPMHRGDNERLYKKFAQEAKEKGAKTNICYAEKQGDSFFYENGKIK